MGRTARTTTSAIGKSSVTPRPANHVSKPWRPATRGGRWGFSLVEVLLVLVVLVLVGALAAPAMSGAYGRGQLRTAASKLAAAWTKARMEAMARGEPRAFRCELGSSRYTVGAAGSPDTASAANDGADVKAPRIESAKFLSFSVTDQNGQRAADPSGESPPLVFQPDGTSADALAVLQSPTGTRMVVTLRGLTGGSTIRLWREQDDQKRP